ncbi:PREDICTED: uncharacterized protein LOC105142630 [Populus euphratica]|uniref:Uncharacterized protein LOC105142630 n=1 Tax=Populus euphratica TaxID=75702 RepID=A0AAJ6VK74_POPEU|nr:PREDICTED: uncharacterized protein LOC105142630 [Populus euphratica]
MPRTTPGAQKSLQNCWQRKEAVERCDLALAKWMFDACVPFNAVNSVYYQHAIDAVTAMGPDYKGRNLHAIRGYYLAKTVDEVKIYVESYREIWKKTGCTLMADGWIDQKRRTLINFLVYCPKGIVFLKTVDVSDVSKTARLLYQLFREVIDGRISFNILVPCVAHCINLILQDIGKLQSVCCVVEHASGITKYIYNHCYPLYLMRKFTGGKEILRPAPTRFATNFIALQSILAHKDELRAMVTSREWVSSAYAKDIKGKKFVESVLDSLFWEECAIIVRMSEPLVRVLRLVDGDDRPSMGYLYDAIHHAKEEMMRRFQKRKPRVKPFIDIINIRWDGQFYRNLYAAAFWLNPRFQYDANIMDKHMSTISGLLDVLEKYAHGNLPLQSKITSEMKFFRNAEYDFGRVFAINNRILMPPVEDDPSILTTEEVESFHQALSTMTIQDTLDDDVINVNEIEDDCDDKVSKEHADDLLGVDEIGSFPSTFDPNFAPMDTEELNVFIQQK